MKLSQWAKKQGIHYRTAWKWFDEGKLPVKAYKTPSGCILIDDSLPESISSEKIVYIYGRVSSNDKKLDLENQVKLCEQYCAAKGWIVKKILKEVASGMNDNRKKLNQVFEEKPNVLVVLYKDRLTRFGFNYLKTLLPKIGVELVVVNENQTENEDLLKDFIAVITSFCCRLYGARRGQAKALKIKTEIRNID